MIFLNCLKSKRNEVNFDISCKCFFFFKTNNACPNQPCNNKCCEDNPCSNGGTCTELCDHAKPKFNCTCATEYYGKFYKKKTPTSCKQLQVVAKNLEESAVHTLNDPTSKSLFQTFVISLLKMDSFGLCSSPSA